MNIRKRYAAYRDLEDIGFYLGRHCVEYALAFLDSAEPTFARLARLPKAGAAGSQSDFPLRAVRHQPLAGFPRYLACYRPAADGIEVLRVLHGTRDLRGLLGGCSS